MIDFSILRNLIYPDSAMVNLWVVILIFSSNLHSNVQSQGHCPLHCSTCLPNLISCTNGGLTSIPNQLQSATEKIILSSQYQFHGVLTAANFTELMPPKYNIVNLSIRSSSVHEIRQRTFTQLIGLKFLDLSENQRLTISTSSFEGLRLTMLKLDDIGKLILSTGCFIGLITESLSMKNSRLQSLNYDIFSPISHTLKHLFIENNQIRTLDQKFESLFYRLETVHLKDNPLICYCPLLWLSKALRSKMMSYKYQSKVQTGQLTTLDPSNVPKCVAPSYLRHRQLQSILEVEFNCQIPRISQIEIDFLSLQTGEMNCKIQSEEKAHKLPTKVFWQENNGKTAQPTNDRLNPEEPESGDPFASVKIRPGSVERRRNYKCIAENSAGRSTLSIRILWPPTRSGANNTATLHKNSSRFSHHDLSLDNHNINNLTPDSYLFTKYYTLLEMTVAIVGTFIITMLIFMLFYRFFFRAQTGYKCGKQTLKYSINGDSPNFNKRSLMAFHSPRGGYTVYETSMQYSDNSQTYESIPQNAVYPHQQTQALFPALSNSPSVHFIDYKTHRNLYPSSPCG